MIFLVFFVFYCFTFLIIYFTKMEEEYVEYYDLNMFEEVEEWDESEIRSLIALIKTNKFLFDKSIKDFSNREKK